MLKKLTPINPVQLLALDNDNFQNFQFNDDQNSCINNLQINSKFLSDKNYYEIFKQLVKFPYLKELQICHTSLINLDQVVCSLKYPNISKLNLSKNQNFDFVKITQLFTDCFPNIKHIILNSLNNKYGVDVLQIIQNVFSKQKQNYMLSWDTFRYDDIIVKLYTVQSNVINFKINKQKQQLSILLDIQVYRVYLSTSIMDIEQTENQQNINLFQLNDFDLVLQPSKQHQYPESNLVFVIVVDTQVFMYDYNKQQFDNNRLQIKYYNQNENQQPQINNSANIQVSQINTESQVKKNVFLNYSPKQSQIQIQSVILDQQKDLRKPKKSNQDQICSQRQLINRELNNLVNIQNQFDMQINNNTDVYKQQSAFDQDKNIIKLQYKYLSANQFNPFKDLQIHSDLQQTINQQEPDHNSDVIPKVRDNYVDQVKHTNQLKNLQKSCVVQDNIQENVSINQQINGLIQNKRKLNDDKQVEESKLIFRNIEKDNQDLNLQQLYNNNIDAERNESTKKYQQQLMGNLANISEIHLQNQSKKIESYNNEETYNQIEQDSKIKELNNQLLQERQKLYQHLNLINDQFIKLIGQFTTDYEEKQNECINQQDQDSKSQLEQKIQTIKQNLDLFQTDQQQIKAQMYIIKVKLVSDQIQDQNELQSQISETKQQLKQLQDTYGIESEQISTQQQQAVQHQQNRQKPFRNQEDEEKIQYNVFKDKQNIFEYMEQLDQVIQIQDQMINTNIIQRQNEEKAKKLMLQHQKENMLYQAGNKDQQKIRQNFLEYNKQLKQQNARQKIVQQNNQNYQIKLSTIDPNNINEVQLYAKLYVNNQQIKTTETKFYYTYENKIIHESFYNCVKLSDIFKQLYEQQYMKQPVHVTVKTGQYAVFAIWNNTIVASNQVIIQGNDKIK